MPPVTGRVGAISNEQHHVNSEDLITANELDWTISQRLRHDYPMLPGNRNMATDTLLVGAAQIGDAFQRSPCTVRRWVKDRVIPFRRLPDGTIVSSYGAIANWILQGEPSE